MNHKQIVNEIGKLEDQHCEPCKNHKCGVCPIGLKIRNYGRQLDSIKKERKPMKNKEVLDIDSYKKYKSQGLNDATIAKKFGIQQATLSYHKKKWFNDEVKPEIKVVEPKEVTTPKKDKLTEYAELITELSNALDLEKEGSAAKDELVKKLQAKIDDLESGSNNVNAACEDLEEEIIRLQDENGKLSKQVKQSEQIKEEFETLVYENQELREENQALKYFARKHLAVV